ncbi:MAG: hypothetical protein WAL47_11805 [Pyrinomonadaceae bacterium]
MTDKPKKRRSFFRVFADDVGKVFLRLEPAGIRVEVERPVTPNKLEQAKTEALNERIKREDEEAAKASATVDPNRTKAQQEIEEAIDPIRKGPWLAKLTYASGQLMLRLFLIFISLLAIAGAYKGIQYSSEHFPEWLHGIILAIYIIVLAGLLWAIGTEENRVKHRKFVLVWFGIYGMLVLPCFLLVTTGAVLASITFRLYNNGSIALETCTGRIVTEAGLLDFFMWHFVNIIPTLQITKLWRWGEPYCYSQSRVGLLIFIFQLLVVIPSFNTIRFYWKHRYRPDFVHDPDWRPEAVD